MAQVTYRNEGKTTYVYLDGAYLGMISQYHQKRGTGLGGTPAHTYYEAVFSVGGERVEIKGVDKRKLKAKVEQAVAKALETVAA